jgi:hypothetical protein
MILQIALLGAHSLRKKLRVLLKVIGVFLALIGVWTIYRVWSATLIILNGELNWRTFFVTQIAFQPLLGVLPMHACKDDSIQ